MENGNLASYLRYHSPRDRLSLVCVFVLIVVWLLILYCKVLGIARGIEYLHNLSLPVIHGDLCAVR